jgi:hypothetical protein
MPPDEIRSFDGINLSRGLKELHEKNVQIYLHCLRFEHCFICMAFQPNVRTHDLTLTLPVWILAAGDLQCDLHISGSII